ncbi:hypothetical protein HT031_002642 [Scenedesmus sp. PABB004]|nr:hypothetical protein HT031_002642 [Scenedesmus sp. PABB004]
MSAAAAALPLTDADGDAPTADQLQALADLPCALSEAAEHEVLSVAAAHVARLAPAAYVRILLAGGDCQPVEVLEWGSDAALVAAARGAADGNASQQAAMRRGAALHVQQLHARHGEYADWRALAQRCGMRSVGVVPLTLAGSVHGALLAASPAPRCFTPSAMARLAAAAQLLAPYAALLAKHEQAGRTRGLLHQLLPARVVRAAIDRVAGAGLARSTSSPPARTPSRATADAAAASLRAALPLRPVTPPPSPWHTRMRHARGPRGRHAAAAADW